MFCGVVPSRHIVFGSPIRALRTRLPSLRSVLPSRQIALNEILLPTNCTNWHEWLQWIKMATGSVARIVTNAMRGGYDDNRDNLRQLEVVSCGCNGNASNYYCPRIIGNFFCPRIARIDTNSCNGLNGDRVGRTNLH